MTDASLGSREQDLYFVNTVGRTEHHRAVLGRDRPVPGRSRFLLRRVKLSYGRMVRQLRLPPAARGDAEARQALEHEVSAAMAIERAYGAGPHGRLFTRVLGHDLDAPEPFVLYPWPEGTPLARLGRPLAGRQLKHVLRELMTAVRLMEHIGYVYRTVTPETVWWSDAGEEGVAPRLSLSEPFGAMPAGSPRRPFGEAPWASPGQRHGTGACDPRDDVWSIAQLMYSLLAGHPGDGEGPPADLAQYSPLRALHDGGAYAPRSADRPGPADVLRLLAIPDPLDGTPLDDLDAGRRAYDEQLAAKRRDLGLDPPKGATGNGGGDGGDDSPPGGLWQRIFGGGRRPPQP